MEGRDDGQFIFVFFSCDFASDISENIKKTVNVKVKKKLTTNFYFLWSKPLSAIEITFNLRF